MEIVVFFVILFIVILGRLGLSYLDTSRKERKYWNRVFDSLSKKYSLSRSPDSPVAKIAAIGVIKNKSVNIFFETFEQGNARLKTIGFKVIYNGVMPLSITVRPEGYFVNSERRVTGQKDIEMNCAEFDKLAWVSGINDYEVRALLHPKAIKIITRLMKDGCRNSFKIDNGVFVCNIPLGLIRNLETLDLYLGMILDLAELLDRPGTAIDLLCENYLAETSFNVKRAYLESLTAADTVLSADDFIIRDALESRVSELQFQALMCMGESADELVPELFKSGDEKLRTALIEYGTVKTRQNLFGFFNSQRDNLTMGEKEALFGYYAAIAVPEAEKFLQEQLYDVVSASETYWRSCIQALAKCGTYESINVLNEFGNRRLKREKDQAIAEIQDRIGAGDSGWLSVGKPEPEAGELSVAAQVNDNAEKQDE